VSMSVPERHLRLLFEKTEAVIDVMGPSKGLQFLYGSPSDIVGPFQDWFKRIMWKGNVPKSIDELLDRFPEEQIPLRARDRTR